MEKLRCFLFCSFLCLAFVIKAQPWIRTMKGPTGAPGYGLSYNYNPHFGGIALHLKQGGNYRHTLISYNNKGDTVFRKQISFDTLGGSPLPIVMPAKLLIDNNGNRVVYGYVMIYNAFSIGNSRTFVIKYDSTGNLISSRYVTAFPLVDNTFELLYSKNNYEYTCLSMNSMGVPFLNNNQTYSYPQVLKQRIVKSDLAGNISWNLQWTQADTTSGGASNSSGYVEYFKETTDGMFSFLRWDKTLTHGLVVSKINANGVYQYSISLSNYINPLNSFVLGAFVTKDTCTNYFGQRTSLSNTNTVEGFLIKINKNGQVVDSLISKSLEFIDGVEISTGKIILSYYNILVGNSAFAEGLMTLDKNYNVQNIRPSQSLEIYNTGIYANNCGGCHLGNYISNSAYTNDYTFTMCNYDSLFNFYPNDLNGVIYEDENKNCLFDQGDNTLNQKAIVCTDANNMNYYTFSSTNGAYDIKLPDGSYTISHLPGQNKSVSCPNPNAVTINYNGSSTSITQNYFDTITPNINDLRVTLVGDPFWIGSAKKVLTVYYENIGATVLNATLQVIKDSLFNYSFSVPQQASTNNGNSLVYFLNALQPGTSGYVSLYFIPSPNIVFGTPTLFKASIFSTANDANISDNSDSIVSLYYGGIELASSLQQVSTSNNINVNRPFIVTGNEELVYKVRFQNTTHAYVKDVLIIDTLDANLDYSTLKIIASTAISSVSIGPSGKLNILFKNINLQDSSAYEFSSRGFVVYSIKPKGSWPVNKIIHNQATIYFDYLSAVTTNQTKNKKVGSFVGIEEIALSERSELNVFPNPANDKLYIRCATTNSISSFDIYNLSGQKIITKIPGASNGLVSLNTENIAAGLYLLKLSTLQGTIVKKIVIEK